MVDFIRLSDMNIKLYERVASVVVKIIEYNMKHIILFLILARLF